MDTRCEIYSDGRAFLDVFDKNRTGCLILEIQIPGVNGLQIQQKLNEAHATLPLIFLTTTASVSIAIHAMRLGAIHFLEKPFHSIDLWKTIQEAIEIDRQRRQTKLLHEGIRTRLEMLSEKEIAVMELIADCKTKGVIAKELGISVRTVEHHRTQLMRKLKANSIAGLLRFALTARHIGFSSKTRPRLSSHDGNGFDGDDDDATLFGSFADSLVPRNGSHGHASSDVLPAWRTIPR